MGLIGKKVTGAFSVATCPRQGLIQRMTWALAFGFWLVGMYLGRDGKPGEGR